MHEPVVWVHEHALKFGRGAAPGLYTCINSKKKNQFLNESIKE